MPKHIKFNREKAQVAEYLPGLVEVVTESGRRVFAVPDQFAQKVELAAILKYNKNHDALGRFSTSPGTAVAHDAGEANSLTAEYASHVKMITAVAKEVAKQRGFPEDKIEIANQIHSFKVGDKEFVSSAQYSSDTGAITVYPHAIDSEDELREVMAHEVTHHIYNRVQSALYKELRAIRDEPNRAEIDGGDYGALKTSAAKKKYPVYAKLQKYLFDIDNSMTLESEDGVTRYSAEYWKASMKGVATKYQAINETLAEIAKLEERGRQQGTLALDGLEGLGVTKMWVGLYQAINEVYRHHVN